MSGNEKCEDDTAAANDDDAGAQHDSYVSAMLRRWHKKHVGRTWCLCDSKNCIL